MQSLIDIYSKMDKKLYNSDFWYKSLEEMKIKVENELKNYALEKIKEVDSSFKYNDESLEKLIHILSNYFSLEDREKNIAHFVHYLLKIAGVIQGYVIIWWHEEREEVPTVEFKGNRWEKLISYKQNSAEEVFNFALDIFKNKHLEPDDKKYLLDNNNK